MPIRSGAMQRPRDCRCGNTLRQRYDEVGLPCSSTIGSPSPTSTYAISRPRTRRRFFWYGNAAEIMLASPLEPFSDLRSHITTPLGRNAAVHHGKNCALMPQLGQTRSFGDVGSMSGLPESGHGWAIYGYTPSHLQSLRARPCSASDGPRPGGFGELKSSPEPKLC